jgi:nucleotide-binding universal stress UspA family protein
MLRVLPKMGFYRDVAAYLESRAKRLEGTVSRVGHDVRWGDPADQILRHARHLKADLIALSRKGRGGVRRSLLGGIPEQVLRGDDLPVLVIRPSMPIRPWKKIVVPLDGSPEAEAALPEAIRLAKASVASISLVRVATRAVIAGGFGYVAPPEDPRPYLRMVSERLEGEGVPTETAVLDGAPALGIAGHAARAKADLICMTTRGRRGLARWLSASVAEGVIRTSPCPVYAWRVRPGRPGAGS